MIWMFPHQMMSISNENYILKFEFSMKIARFPRSNFVLNSKLDQSSKSNSGIKKFNTNGFDSKQIKSTRLKNPSA